MADKSPANQIEHIHPDSVDALTIVMACDESYAMPLATALRSLAESNRRSWPVTVYVLTDRFSEYARNDVAISLPEGAINLTWLNVDLQSFHKLSTLRHISLVTFARLLVAEQLPKSLERFIYLDSDLLVLRDLHALWRINLQGKCVAAVTDDWLDSVIREDRAYREEPNLPIVERYFNAGVMLVDFERWSSNKVGDKALKYLTEHPLTPYADQDALNVSLDCNWLPVSNQWNFQGHLTTRIRLMPEPPAIVHFITSAKPWLREHGTPNEALFDSYRRRTRFARRKADYATDLRKSSWMLLKRIARKLTNPISQVSGPSKLG